MTQTHTATRSLAAPPAACFDAWTDPAALARWLPPDGMSGTVRSFDASEGGTFVIVLTHEAGPNDLAKSGDDTDVVEGRFVTLDRPGVVAFESRFDSDKPEFAGTMRMTWRFDPAPDGGTLASVVAEGVPPGIPQDIHEAGIAASLANLDRYLDAAPAPGGAGHRTEPE